jgi:hypothetical protein
MGVLLVLRDGAWAHAQAYAALLRIAEAQEAHDRDAARKARLAANIEMKLAIDQARETAAQWEQT